MKLSDIERALAPITSLRQELETTVNGLRIVLRQLSPEEESESDASIFKGMKSIEGEEDISVLDRQLTLYQTELLSRSIVEIGDLDLRNTIKIETENSTPEQPEFITRHAALRKMIQNWTTETTRLVFLKYADLIAKAGQKLMDAMQFSSLDLETEIERLEQRLERCKKELESRKEPTRSSFDHKVEAVADLIVEKQDRAQEVIEQVTSTLLSPRLQK